MTAEDQPGPIARLTARLPILRRTSIIARSELAGRKPGSGGGEALVIEGVPRLVGLSDVVINLRVRLDQQQIDLGRAADNDIVIQDDTVSAHHARLVASNGTWRVVNLVSANGTAVNGEACIVRYLAPDDVISLGRVELAFRGRSSGKRATAVLVDVREEPRGSGAWWLLLAAAGILALAALVLLLPT